MSVKNMMYSIFPSWMKNHTTYRAIFEKNKSQVQKPILIMDGDIALLLVNLFFVPEADTEKYLPHTLV